MSEKFDETNFHLRITVATKRNHAISKSMVVSGSCEDGQNGDRRNIKFCCLLG